MPLGLLAQTSIVVTSLNSPTASQAAGVPWIAAGSGIKSGYAIRGPMSIIDTGATVMRMMGLQTHTEWDSHVVEEIFRGGPLAPVATRTESERP